MNFAALANVEVQAEFPAVDAVEVPSAFEISRRGLLDTDLAQVVSAFVSRGQLHWRCFQFDDTALSCSGQEAVSEN